VRVSINRGQAPHRFIPVQNLERAISKANAGQLITKYLELVEEVGNPVANFKGLRLIQALKREAVKAGPYPKVTLFEAANRIMSDLVVLYGVKWLLDNSVFPFGTYTVEYGIDNKDGFDIQATGDGKRLVGEAFNVAPSFFQTKKTSTLKKIRQRDVSADYKIIMFNHDAVESSYKPKPKNNEFFVFVHVGTDDSYIVPNERLHPSAQKGGGGC
jgi:hypothetical protein